MIKYKHIYNKFKINFLHFPFKENIFSFYSKVNLILLINQFLSYNYKVVENCVPTWTMVTKKLQQYAIWSKSYNIAWSENLIHSFDQNKQSYLQVVGDDVKKQFCRADHSINSLTFNTTNIIGNEKTKTSVFTISLHTTFIGHSTIIDRLAPPRN